MLNKKSIDDINVKGKRVLCRCDFNVPFDGSRITDETRLVAALPTIKKLITDGGKVILCSHLGKPKGPDAAFSLAPVAKRLSELLGQEVKFAADDTVVGDNARAAVVAMNDGDVILLENTRFRPEETKNGEAFSKDLASITDVFVNDAFGTAHRAHCSNVGVTQYVDTAVVGYLMQKEIDFLGNAVNNPVRPFVAILGGSKVSSKISVIDNLLDKVDTLIIGGGMSYTFQKAHGGKVGKSLVEDDYVDYAKNMMKKAEEKGVKMLIPIDTVVAKEFSNDSPSHVVVAGNQADDDMGMDIGPKTCELDAIVCENDGMAVGAANALGEDSGVIITGVDASDDGLEAIAAGLQTGTVSQDAVYQGYLAVQLAVDCLDGTVKSYDEYLVENVWVTEDNVADFLA